MSREWYAFAWWGSGPHPAKGPYSSLDDAAKALDTFHGRYGADADSWLTSGDVQLRGPYATRAQAERADISDDPAPRVDLRSLYQIEFKY